MSHTGTRERQYYRCICYVVWTRYTFAVLFAAQGQETVTEREENEHPIPITPKGMEGKRATARRERWEQGKAHRQDEKIILYNTEHTHTHTQMFSQYRLFWISPAPSPDFISIRVYLYIQGFTSHTQTHTRSQFMSVSRLYVCLIERGGGFPLSRERCVVRCVAYGYLY